MNAVIRIRHVASMAGAVRDKATLQRVGGALVEILEGPPAYVALLAALAADPAWQRRADRPDRVFSQPDGIFCFVDLPPGAYRLRVSAPEMGTRFGAVEIGPFEVKPAPAEGPFPVARADVDLPPTRIHGVVTDSVTGNVIPAARVRLLGDTTVVQTGDDGVFDLSRLVAGKPSVQIAAPGFRPVTRQLELVAGQERVENFALQPE